jgi:hypothetical protein
MPRPEEEGEGREEGEEEEEEERGGKDKGPSRTRQASHPDTDQRDDSRCHIMPGDSRCHFLRRREEGLAAIIAGTVAASRPRQPAKGAPAIQMAMPGRSEQRGGAIVHGSSFLLSMYDLQSTSSFSIEKQQIKRPQHKLPVTPHKKNETETATATTQQQSKKVFLNIELACAVA